MRLRDSSKGAKSFEGLVGHLQRVEHLLDAEFAQCRFAGLVEVRANHYGKTADSAFAHVCDEVSDCGKISSDPVTHEVDTFVASGFGGLFGALGAAEDNFKSGVAKPSGHGPVHAGIDAVFAAQ